MSKSLFALMLLPAALVLVAGCGNPDTTPEPNSTSPMDLLVSVEWLHEHLDDPDLVVIDASVPVESDGEGGFRTVSGRAAYEAGHIPTAGFADLKGDLADPNSSLDFAVPPPEQFAAAMGALGVGDNTRVIIYDSYGSAWAARVWWMLRWVGFDNAALLDGGLEAWKSAGYALSSEPASEPARTLTVNLRPQLIVERDEMRAAIDDEDVNIIDALPEAHFNGDFTMYDRPGHIPTAENIPSMSLVDESGQFKSDDELNILFGTDRDRRTITYCGGGIAASADAFVMTRLGYKDVAVYTASLQEWAADPKNPMVTGTARQ